MKSFKTKSRVITILTTIVIAIVTYIASMNPDQLANQLGIYGSWAGVIIVICASIINQLSEEKRVQRAEYIVSKEYANDPPIRVEVDTTDCEKLIEKKKQELLEKGELSEPPIVTTEVVENTSDVKEPEIVDSDTQ